MKKHATIWEARGRWNQPIGVVAGYPDSRFAGRADDVCHKLVPRRGDWLLDAGSGPGVLAATLKDHFSRIVALDLALSNLRRICADEPRLKRVQGNVHRLPFKSAAFDRVLCYGVLHYFPSWEVAGEVVRELLRVSKPGGRILIGDIEPLINTAFSPPVVKQPVNVAEYDPELTYLCFEPAFFENLLAPVEHTPIFENTWEGSGHFDVIVEVPRA